MDSERGGGGRQAGRKRDPNHVDGHLKVSESTEEETEIQESRSCNAGNMTGRRSRRIDSV